MRQIMHLGSYDDEPGTILQMKEFLEKEGYITDINKKRRHHEIYFNDRSVKYGRKRIYK